MTVRTDAGRTSVPYLRDDDHVTGTAETGRVRGSRAEQTVRSAELAQDLVHLLAEPAELGAVGHRQVGELLLALRGEPQHRPAGIFGIDDSFHEAVGLGASHQLGG